VSAGGAGKTLFEVLTGQKPPEATADEARAAALASLARWGSLSVDASCVWEAVPYEALADVGLARRKGDLAYEITPAGRAAARQAARAAAGRDTR
jgi:hypothetical protein